MSDKIIKETKEWIEKAVIGLNLCPFAQNVYIKNQIRYVVHDESSVETLLKVVKQQMDELVLADPKITDTTLIIHPNVLSQFREFNEFLGALEEVVIEKELSGVLQVASFHPYYQFEGTTPDDIQNYTNRSPYPILQLLREHSVEKNLKDFEDPDDIFRTNIKTLNTLGYSGWKKLFETN